MSASSPVVIIDGVRYKRGDAVRLGKLQDKPEGAKKPTTSTDAPPASAARGASTARKG